MGGEYRNLHRKAGGHDLLVAKLGTGMVASYHAEALPEGGTKLVLRYGSGTVEEYVTETEEEVRRALEG